MHTVTRVWFTAAAFVASLFLALGLAVAITVADTRQLHAGTVTARPLVTAVYLSDSSGAAAQREARRVAKTGAAAVRVNILWSRVAPAAEPATWDPTDPADPNYAWANYDDEIRAAAGAGLRVYVTVMGAPTWAQTAPAEPDVTNAHIPDATAFGRFAQAVARRYSGAFEGLPRVREFQAWNEPNISLYLTPQFENGQPASPRVYRELLNAFAKGVRAVHADNVVVAGGLAPFRDITPSVMAQDKDWGPLSFMRALLCVSRTGKSTCNTRVDFDVWAMHPYTSGGPTHHAVLPNDVSLGDLPEMKKTLDAAARLGHTSARAPGFWVTEFSWDSAPPDPKGVPTPLLTRWVAEALYRMWDNGVSLVTWLMLVDQPITQGFYQSGLWTSGATSAGDVPKPIVQAFRFPFVAFRGNSGVDVWGRTPSSRRAVVVVERTSGTGWRPVQRLSADRFGIFRSKLQVPAGTKSLRARVSSAKSPAFSLAVPPDRFFNPFGQPTLLEPKEK
jgi:hypothetical protein